jgi:hypothetical protein
MSSPAFVIVAVLCVTKVAVLVAAATLFYRSEGSFSTTASSGT